LVLESLEDRRLLSVLSFRQETRADDAEAPYGVTGKGVTVAILDRGIDWRHPDFIKPDGTTRINWLLDMSPDNPSPVEYSEAQINAALAGGTPINSRDAVGHGTVTAGIAAGNGSGTADHFYRGMAPDADLVVVKMTSEGAPAHDGQPAEASFQANIDDALNWLDQKITLLGQPAVGLINSGVQWGPIDGTSAVSRKIDQVFGLDRPGRAYVSASGDEGNLNNHAGADYDDSGDTIIRFTKSTTQTVYLPIWYTGSQPAQVTITFDDGTTVGPVDPGQYRDQNGIYIIQYQPGQEFYPWQSTSGDRAVWTRIIGHSGGGSVRLHGTVPGTGHADVYGEDGVTGIFNFTDHLVPGRLTDYSATRSAIVAGAHVLQTTYTDIDHVFRNLGTGQGAAGDRWTGSSGGPSRDGRPIVVDVTASGHNVFAAYGQNSYWSTFRFNLVEDGGGLYGRQGATSGSAPVVLGGVALLFQMYPQLTARQIKQVLDQTAVSDDFTGTTPNPDWGYGKLDVKAALDALSGGGGSGGAGGASSGFVHSLPAALIGKGILENIGFKSVMIPDVVGISWPAGPGLGLLLHQPDFGYLATATITTAPRFLIPAQGQSAAGSRPLGDIELHGTYRDLLLNQWMNLDAVIGRKPNARPQTVPGIDDADEILGTGI
jgi:hypothetical protein